MRKIIITIIAFFCALTAVNAAGLTASVSCPSTGLPSAEIECVLTVGSSTSTPICALSGKYQITNGTKVSFTKGAFSFTSNGTSGFAINMGDGECYTASKTIGTLKVKLPSTSGTTTIRFHSIESSDDLGVNKATASDITKTITVSAPSSVNTLSNLTLSTGTLSPAFSSSVTNYTATVDAASVTITATKTDNKSTVSGDGTKNLSYGTNTFTIQVTAETGDKKTYTIVITRPDNRSDDNTLRALSITGGTLSPSFSANVMEYTATVTTATTTISATQNDTRATITGTGSKSLSYGLNTFKVDVTSEKGTKKTYILKITRQDIRDADNTLKTLSLSVGTLSPSFVSTTTSYTAKVAANTSKITVNATANSSKASFVSGFGSRQVNLEYGVNKIQVKVLNEKLETRIYTITVTREDNRNTNNFLKTLTVTDGKMTFNKNTFEYTMTVNYKVSKVTIAATAEDTKATITGAGEKALKVGINTFTIVVTAENTSTRIYKVNVTRLGENESPSSNNNLKTLFVAGHDELVFDKEILRYEVNLSYKENKLDLTYFSEDDKAVVSVEGNENLKDGSIIKITVTATDGEVKVYELVVNKEEAPADLEKEVKPKEKVEITTGLIIGIISVLAILITIVVFVVISKKRKSSTI